MHRFLGFVLLLFVFSTSKAVPLDFKGTVLDKKTNEPVIGAIIKAYYNRNEFSNATTDSNGTFTIALSYGLKEFFLEISKEGYLNYKTKIFFNSNQKNVFHIETKEYSLPTLEVTSQRGKNYTNELHNYESTIEGKKLITSISSTLGLTLRNESEIFVRSMGPATSKPVFRGLSLEYFNIFENNLPVKDLSTTAPDHSTAIDPINYEKIEMIRGPKLLTYTNNAIGGLVNLKTKDYLIEKIDLPMVNGTSLYESAYNALGYNLKWEMPIKDFFTAGATSLRNAGDMKSGKGIVPNTYFKSKSGNIIGGMNIKSFSFLVEGEMFQSKYGIPGGFVGAHPNGVDIDLEKSALKFESLLHLHSFVDNINFNFSRNYYHHIEYEKSNAIGAEFLLHNFYSNLHINFFQSKIFNESTLGFTFEKSYNDFGGYVFTPKVNSSMFSAYFFQNIQLGKHYIDYSLRFDHKNYYPIITEHLKKNPPKSRTFNNLSFSILVMHNLGAKSYLGFNFGKSERFPTLEELYSNGPHLAAYSYEIGNTNLMKEEAWFGELSYSFKSSTLEIYASSYFYDFANFLYPLNTGKINVAQLLPIYQISNTRANLLGFASSTKYEPLDNLSLLLHFSYSRGINKTTSTSLPMIPPAKGSFEVYYKYKKLEITLTNTFTFRQNDVGEFEQPTQGYTIFSINIRYPFTFQKLASVINFNIDNIFNTTYYNHLSRIKSIFPEPGRNIRLLLSIYY